MVSSSIQTEAILGSFRAARRSVCAPGSALVAKEWSQRHADRKARTSCSDLVENAFQRTAGNLFVGQRHEPGARAMYSLKPAESAPRDALLHKFARLEHLQGDEAIERAERLPRASMPRRHPQT